MSRPSDALDIPHSSLPAFLPSARARADMTPRRLGSSGLQVSPITFGAMRITVIAAADKGPLDAGLFDRGASAASTCS